MSSSPAPRIIRGVDRKGDPIPVCTSANCRRLLLGETRVASAVVVSQAQVETSIYCVRCAFERGIGSTITMAQQKSKRRRT